MIGDRLITHFILLFVALSPFCSASGTENFRPLKYIRTSSDEPTQSAAALDVVYRTIPDYADYFRVKINFSLPNNYFEVDANVPSTGYVDILASSGVVAIRGFYDYIRNVHKGQVAWEGKHIDIKSMNDIYRYNEQADSDFIYFQNVCTFSYTYAWWNFEDWRRHIDWIAMHGINLVLAPFQEDIWYELYTELGLNDDEISEHFTGPAFFAWQRMGNLRGFAGPLENSFIEFSSDLQQKIIKEYQRLGINFAIPSFAGHVPVGFQRLYPNTTFQRTRGWNGFPKKNCCPLFIDPTDPLFYEIGTKFLNKMIRKYGTSHIYFADPFNELVPHTSDPEYLASVSKAIHNVMKTVDSQATWLLQGWMFYNEAHFWQDAQIEAFLTAVPIGEILVLDLHSDMFPQFERTKSYYGQPFIWNMLHNFGGNLGLRGSAALIADRAYKTYNNPSMTMVGLGVTPEGINQNHVIYEFALDLAWTGKRSFSTVDWFRNYGKRRHGNAYNHDTWTILHDTIYNYNGTRRIDGILPYLVVDSPSVNLKPWSWFHPENIKTVLKNILSKELYGNQLFDYDVVDFTRQYLQNMIDLQYILIVDGFRNRILEKVNYHSKIFLDMISDMDRILSCDVNFLLGRWLESAKSLSQNNKDIIEYNARNQITLWGARGEIKNYAIKQWAGLTKDYVLPRWQLFWTELEHAMDKETIFVEILVRLKIFNDIENPFNDARKTYDTGTNCGNLIYIAKNIFKRYENLYIDPKTLDKYLNENAKIPNDEL